MYEIIQKISRLATLELLTLANVTCESNLQVNALNFGTESMLAFCNKNLPKLFISHTEPDRANNYAGPFSERIATQANWILHPSDLREMIIKRTGLSNYNQ